MHTNTLQKLALALTFWLAVHISPVRATDETISGNLTVTGNSDLQGNTLTLGTNSSNSDAGALTLYTDGTRSTLEFDASRSANIWKWQQNGSGTLQMQMSLNLSNQNELVLYNQATPPAARITLNPIGTSTFANSVTVNGTDNEMPNQTLANGNSVLTESLADSRYASASYFSFGTASSMYNSALPNLGLLGGSASGAHSFAVGGNNFYPATASGSYSVALGPATASGAYSAALGYGAGGGGMYSVAIGWSDADGQGSVAMGYGATATGQGSVALCFATASGWYATAMGYNTDGCGGYSTAMGNNTFACGNSSTSMGNFTTACGFASVAAGNNTSASGDYSTANGNLTTASSLDSFTIGAYNVGGGDPHDWVLIDPLFEIGNGSSSNTPSDALVVYKNGNMTAGGVITAQPGGDIPMYTGN